MKTFALSFLLGLASLATARTDLQGCVSSEVIVEQYYASYIWYVPGTGEICSFLDCGGGRAPPKTNQPGCPLYSGTATLTPDYLAGWGPNGKQAASTSTVASTSSATAASTTDVVLASATQTSEASVSDSTQAADSMITAAPSSLTAVASSLKISTSSALSTGNATSSAAAATSSPAFNAATIPASNVAGIMAVLAAMVGVMVL
ncbi:uncharacterized protein N7518_010350 [Penicillium psychrosexuale]|uniref:uncharacterized protein n=1 Tax=Penicillium psychrosexuale TaxID=1002107 RepID=UPI0025457B3F|nr:uncharacterized protein N7518_010350 [Penicillium psychrosexuale]KAJ5781867.1 hypothetical protein N7518_010350 [Penicillium psychrosexuale]